MRALPGAIAYARAGRSIAGAVVAVDVGAQVLLCAQGADVGVITLADGGAVLDLALAVRATGEVQARVWWATTATAAGAVAGDTAQPMQSVPPSW